MILISPTTGHSPWAQFLPGSGQEVFFPWNPCKFFSAGVPHGDLLNRCIKGHISRHVVRSELRVPLLLVLIKNCFEVVIRKRVLVFVVEHRRIINFFEKSLSFRNENRMESANGKRRSGWNFA